MTDLSSIPMTDVIDSAAEAGAITDQVDAIKEKLSSYTVGTLPNNKFQLAQALKGVEGAQQAAGALLDYMRSVELIGQAGATPVAPVPASTGPQTINVVTPPTRGEMNLKQLLEELVAHPEDGTEIAEYLRGLTIIQKAERRLANASRHGQWVVLNKDNSLNVDETAAYVRYVADDRNHIPPTWFVGETEYWPTTLDRALGNDGRFLIYPFTDDPREMLFRGRDKFGLDWASLDETLHEAIIDGVATGKISVSNEADVRRVSYEIFQSPLPAWLAAIVREYKVRKDRGDIEIKRYATPEQFRAAGLNLDGTAGSRHPFGGSQAPVRDDAWYLAQLEALRGREINVTSSDCSASREVIPYVRATSADIHLDRVIVLGDVVCTSGDISGFALCAPGARIAASSGTIARGIKRASSWKELYDKAVEWGIIPA